MFCPRSCVLAPFSQAHTAVDAYSLIRRASPPPPPPTPPLLFKLLSSLCCYFRSHDLMSLKPSAAAQAGHQPSRKKDRMAKGWNLCVFGFVPRTFDCALHTNGSLQKRHFHTLWSCCSWRSIDWYRNTGAHHNPDMIGRKVQCWPGFRRQHLSANGEQRLCISTYSFMAQCNLNAIQTATCTSVIANWSVGTLVSNSAATAPLCMQDIFSFFLIFLPGPGACCPGSLHDDSLICHGSTDTMHVCTATTLRFQPPSVRIHQFFYFFFAATKSSWIHFKAGCNKKNEFWYFDFECSFNSLMPSTSEQKPTRVVHYSALETNAT